MMPNGKVKKFIYEQYHNVMDRDGRTEIVKQYRTLHASAF